MSFDLYYYSMVIRQQELTRAELLRADAQVAQTANGIRRLGRTAAQAARIPRQAASF